MTKEEVINLYKKLQTLPYQSKEYAEIISLISDDPTFNISDPEIIETIEGLQSIISYIKKINEKER